MKRYSGLIAGMLFLFTGTCTAPEDQYSPVYKKFEGGTVYHIHFSEADIIDLGPEHFETIRAPEGALYDAGAGWWPEAMGDSLLLVDNRRTRIKSIHLPAGELLGEYTFEGRGPGEYQRINYFFATDRDRFIVDVGSMKVIRYNHLWEHVGDYFLKGVMPLMGSSKFGYHSSWFYYPVGTDENYVIYRKHLEDETEEIGAFHNRIISLGKQPGNYNLVLLDISPTGELVATNPSLPVLFLYNRNRDLDGIYRIHFPGLDLIETGTAGVEHRAGIDEAGGQVLLNPPPVEIEADQRVRMHRFISDIVYGGERLFVRYGNQYAELSFITMLTQKNGEWIHSGSFRIRREDGSFFSGYQLSWSEPWLYLTTPEFEDIIRVNIGALEGM